jgi:tRNA-intron endonuclease
LSESLDAYYKKRRVYIPESDRQIEFLDRGFGTRRGKKLELSPYEAFFLTEKGRIKVTDEDTQEILSLHDLVTELSMGKQEIWIRYLVYRDLRERGYIVRETKKVDFEIHGKGAERRLISIVYEGGESSLHELTNLLRYAARQKKELILSVIDRRTDLVYYSIGEMIFQKNKAKPPKNDQST